MQKLIRKRKIAERPCPDNKQVIDLLCEVALKEALKGDFRFISFIHQLDGDAQIEQLREELDAVIADRRNPAGSGMAPKQ